MEVESATVTRLEAGLQNNDIVRAIDEVVSPVRGQVISVFKNKIKGPMATVRWFDGRQTSHIQKDLQQLDAGQVLSDMEKLATQLAEYLTTEKVVSLAADALKEDPLKQEMEKAEASIGTQFSDVFIDVSSMLHVQAVDHFKRHTSMVNSFVFGKKRPGQLLETVFERNCETLDTDYVDQLMKSALRGSLSRYIQQGASAVMDKLRNRK